ncbi:tandem-95 repeat protein [Nocardioides humilatus]|uniref:Tandem-95 repeat protein n=1 Tax=Nocardioides humilatus TaxID=2607660 RepID=A0A5B1LMV3_9ACTN|nr:tandem-95 repeat protein [Nocardioides humilatus]KAA1420959.1 tandem-95 repeat protein [Nocardioides humilatus]
MNARINLATVTSIALLLQGIVGTAAATPPPLNSACTITGTVRDDTLTGTAESDVICGLSGNDTIYGLGGDDLILGGVGADTIEGGDGDDDVRGGPADDNILGDAGADKLYGDGDNDTIEGGDDADVLVGSGGNDVLTGGLANDVLWGQGGADQVNGGDGDDKAVGGGGDDVVHGDAGVDRVFGEPGDDQLYGDDDGDTLRGGRGSDTHSGGVGDDTVHDRDGAPFIDTVSCNEGLADRVFVDFRDLVGGDCEQVEVLDAEDPVAVADAKTVVEDAAARAIDVLANDTDADGGPKKVASVTQPTNGAVTVAGNGSRVYYQPDADYCNAPGRAADTFDYTLAPGGSTATVSVKVACRDDAPVAEDDTKTVVERDPATTIDVLANDSDVDGDSFTVDQVTQPANGTVVITNAGADLTYEPDNGYCNSDPVGSPTDDFTYTLAPGGDTATVAVTVTCGDEPAVAADDTKTVDEDDPATTIDVLANDDPGDHAPITIDSVTQPAHGTVVITNAGADLTYEPDADYCNDGTPTDDFTYTLTPDGDTATVAVTVTCVEDDPEAVDDTKTVDEDDPATTIDVLGNDSDAEGDGFTIDSVTQPAHGTVVITNAGADLTYEPNADYCNDGTPTDDFTYTLTPGGDTATVAVTVSCVDDDPTALADSANLVEDDPATTIDVLANDTDPENDPFTIDQTTQPLNGTVVVTNAGADLTYEPDPDYCNDPPGLALDTFTYTLAPGGDTATVTVTVACSGNDAPVLAGIEGSTLAYVENDPATQITATVTVFDVDSADFDGGTLSVFYPTSGSANDRTEIRNEGTGAGQIGVSGADVTFGGTVIGSFTGGTTSLTVTFTNAATPAAVQALIRAVTYRNVSDAPFTANRKVRFVVTDGDGGTSNAVDRTVSVTPVNDAPVIGSVESSALAYAENAAATVITAAGTVADVDSVDFAGGTLTVDFSAGGLAEDRLEIRNQGTGAGQIGVSGSNVTYAGSTVGSFTGGSGTTPLVITLSSNSNPTVGQALLRNITYRNVSDTPSTTNRTVRFVLTDGDGGTSNAATRVVMVASVNDAPVVTLDSGAVTYTEDGAPAIISPNLTITDLDNANLTQAVITFSASVPGDHVTFTGAGTLFTSSFNSTTGVATINPIGTRTVAEWQTMLRTFAFYSDLDLLASPSTTATFTVNDGATTSAPQSRVINLTNVNDAPVVANIEGATLSYTENAAALPITATGTVADVDSTNFGFGNLTVDFSAGGLAEDRLEIRNQGTGAGQIGVSGTDVTYGGVVFASFSGGTNGSTPLVISLRGAAIPSWTEALLRNITYRDIADKPTTANRTIRIVLVDGDGGTSAAVTRTAAVVAVNDPPVVNNFESTALAYVENSPATVITATGQVVEVDSTDLLGGSLTVDFSAGGLAEDRLEIRNQGVGAGQIGVTGANVTYGGITIGNFSGGTGTTPLVVNLLATSNQQNVSALMRNITYRNVSANPSTANRTVRFVVNDGDGGTSGPGTRVITVAAVNAAPVIAAIESASLSYTENAAGTVITATSTVSDVDSANFDTGALTVDFSAGGKTEDRLEVRNQGTAAGQIGVSGSNVTFGGVTIGTFTGGSGTTPLVITFNASTTPAAAQALVRNITYRNVSDNPATTDRTARFVVTDGDGGTSAGVTRVITVTAVNDAPSLSFQDVGPAAFTENLWVFVSNVPTVADVDSTNFDTGTLTVDITAGGNTSQDVLRIQTPNSTGITVVGSDVRYNATSIGTVAGGTGGAPLVITLNANALSSNLAVYALVRSIAYANSSDNPSTTDRTVRAVLKDGDGGTSAPATRTVTITAVNDPPIPTYDAGSLTYTENASAVLVAPNGTVTDPDSADFAGGSMTVSTSTGAQTADRYEVRNQGTGAGQIGVSGTTVTYGGVTIGTITDDSPLVVSFNGSVTPAVAQALFRNLTYRHEGDNPVSSKVVVTAFNDGDGAASGSRTRTLTVTPINDAPVLDNIESSALDTGANGAGVLITASTTVFDVDSTSFALGELTVDFASGGQPEDRIEIRNQGTGAGQFDLINRSLRYQGSPIGSINVNGGVGTTPLIVSFGNVTPAIAQALIRNITYRNVVPNPSTVDRTVRFVVKDGAGGTSGPETRVIHLVGVNAAPVVGSIEGTPLSYVENALASPITSTGTVADADSANFDTGSLTVDYSAGAQAEDRLEIRNQGTGAGQIGVSGANVTFGGVTIGTFAGGSGTTALVITFNASATPAAGQALLRNVTYRNVSEAPNTGARTVRFIVSDGDGASSAAVTRQVTPTAVNDVPTLSDPSSPTAFVENSTAVRVSNGLLVADVDNANLASATLTINSPVSADLLSFTNQSGITGSFASGVLTLTGSASVATYQAALRTITFSNPTSNTPGTSRTITIVVNDGTASSAGLNRVIPITLVNDPPVISDVTAGTGYTENSPTPALVSPALNASDPDDANLASASYTISSPVAGDQLLFTNQAGITGSYASGVLTLTGTAPVATYQAALRTVGFTNTSDAPGPNSRTIVVRVNDGSGGSAQINRTVSVANVNDAPTLTGIESAPLGYTQGDPATPVTTAVTVTDPDSANFDSGAFAAEFSAGGMAEDRLDIRNQGTGAGQIGVSGATVTYGGTSIGTYSAGNGSLPLTVSFNASATPAAAQALVRNVTYRNIGSPPSTATRTVRFVLTDDVGDSSAPATRNVTVTRSGATPVAVADTYSVTGNTALYVGTTKPATQAGKVVTGSLLDNDTDADTAHASLVAEPVTNAATTQGGSITIEADGNFTYVPDDGDTGITDTFTYRVCDATPCNSSTSHTATGTASFSITGRVWYVNNALPTNGDGRSSSPYNTSVGLGAGGIDPDAAGDTIFLFQGSGSYAGVMALEASQRLIGQPEGLVVGGTTLFPASGTNPTITNPSGYGIYLANDVVVRRVNVANTSDAGIIGFGVTNADIGPNLSITGTGDSSLYLTGGSGTITMAGSINHSSAAANVVLIQGRGPGSSAVFSGPIASTGGGVQIFSSPTTTTSFTGGLTLSTGSAQGFGLDNGGTVTVTGANNVIATTTSVGVFVRNTEIGAAGMTFKSVSVNGAGQGIVLDNTGSSGFFTVTGSGTADSGGTIQNTLDTGISLDNVAHVSFNYMRISGTDRSGVRGAGVTDFTFTHGSIINAGDLHQVDTDSAFEFSYDTGGDNNIDGAVTITDNTITNPYGSGIAISNYAGTITDANISNNTITSSDDSSLSQHSGIALQLLGSSTTVASLTKATISGNVITGFPSADAIAVQGGNKSTSTAPAGTYGVPGSATDKITISSNRILGHTTNPTTGSAIAAGVIGRGQGNFDIANNGSTANPIAFFRGTVIALTATGSATVDFRVYRNTILALTPSPGSPGISLVTDKSVQTNATTLATPTVHATIESNWVRQTGASSLLVLQRDSNGAAAINVDSNIFNEIGGDTLSGIIVQNGSTGSGSFNPTMCARIVTNTSGSSNPSVGSTRNAGINLYKATTSSSTYRFGIVGLAPSPSTAAQTETYVGGLNPSSITGVGSIFDGKRAVVRQGDQFTSCTLPTMP